MCISMLARYALVAALVFSQALYAGHGISHDAGSQSDCQICLQASNSGAAPPAGGINAFIDSYALPRIKPGFTAHYSYSFPNSNPSRAPPSFPF